MLCFVRPVSRRSLEGYNGMFRVGHGMFQIQDGMWPWSADSRRAAHVRS